MAKCGNRQEEFSIKRPYEMRGESGKGNIAGREFPSDQSGVAWQGMGARDCCMGALSLPLAWNKALVFFRDFTAWHTVPPIDCGRISFAAIPLILCRVGNTRTADA